MSQATRHQPQTTVAAAAAEKVAVIATAAAAAALEGEALAVVTGLELTVRIHKPPNISRNDY